MENGYPLRWDISMKRIFHIPKKWTLGLIFIVYLVVMVLFLLWASQLLTRVSADNPARKPLLLVPSLILPFILLGTAGIAFVRVVAQRRNGVPGSRLRLHLIGSFALTVAVTAIPIGILSSMFLKTAIGFWLAPGNGRALNAGKQLGVAYYRDVQDKLRAVAESDYLADLLERQKASDIWQGLSDVAPFVNAFQVVGVDEVWTVGNPLFFFQSDDLSDYHSNGPLPRRIIDGQTILSWQHQFGNSRMILSTQLPAAFEKGTRDIALASDDWKRYVNMERNLVAALLVFGLFLSGPFVLLAFLMAMAMSERIIQPLVSLRDATGKISEGNFSFRAMSSRDDDLGFLSESFNQMISELEENRTQIIQDEKVTTWQIIAQKLAHELRNPLTPIKLSAQRIQRKAAESSLDNETLRKSIKLILQEVDGLDKLLQDFRDFAGEGAPQLSNLSLKLIFDEMIDRFSTVNPSVEWRHIAADDELQVQGDPLQIRQVLVNLLKNSIEAGATTITIQGSMVLRGRVPYVRMMIRDNGEGIAADRSASVFQPYESTRVRGTGLGLAVVQRIIYNHNGRIWFESEPGSETVFYIELPTGVQK